MISFFIVVIIVFSFSALISYFWVEGLDYMIKNHPDYTGNDLFGENEEKEA